MTEPEQQQTSATPANESSSHGERSAVPAQPSTVAAQTSSEHTATSNTDSHTTVSSTPASAPANVDAPTPVTARTSTSAAPAQASSSTAQQAADTATSQSAQTSSEDHTKPSLAQILASDHPTADDDLEYESQKKLQYGALESDFGPSYNPYIFGRPEPSDKEKAQQQNPQQNMPFGQPYQQQGQSQNGQPTNHNAAPYGNGHPTNPQAPNNPYQNNPFGFSFNPYAARPSQQQGNVTYDQNGIPHTQDGHTPRYINGLDVNDPAQNPWYGRWDSYSIIAFIFSVLFSVPVLPALMGILGIWRTRTFHMKGIGLAIAAVVINVIYTILFVWMTMHGISATDMLNNLMGQYSQMLGGSGSSTNA